MAIFTKGCKPDNFELHNTLKLSCTNIWGRLSNFLECESFIESNTWHSMWDKLGWLNWFWQYLCKGLTFIYSYTWYCSLCEGRTSFCKGSSANSYWCFRLALLHWAQCSTSFSFVDHLLHLYAWFLTVFYSFCQSTHLLMCLSLETFISIIGTG